MKTRTCVKCQATKPLSDFGPDKRASDGCQSRCRECTRADKRAWQSANREKWLVLHRTNSRAYKMRMKLALQAQNHDFYVRCQRREDNQQLAERGERRCYICKRVFPLPEFRVGKTTSSYCRKCRSDKNKAYRTPEINRQIAALRAEIYVNGSLTASEWQSALIYFGGCCAYCGKYGRLEQDHFIPVRLYGDHARWNVVPACRSCNARKNGKNGRAWTIERFGESKYEQLVTYLAGRRHG